MYEYRLRPNRLQEQALTHTLDLCRELYNAALQEKRDAYTKQGVSLNCAKQQAELLDVKQERPEYASVYAQVLQDVLKRLHRAYDGFYRRVRAGETPGFPRFKSKDRYHSFTFPQVSRPDKGRILKTGGVERLANGRLRVHGVPGALKVIWHRTMLGIPKTATFKRKGEHWYVLFACDDVPVEEREKTGRDCAIDLGLEAFATLDDGTRIENPRHFAKAQENLRTAQRRADHRRNRSKRQRKARRLAAKIASKVGRQRKDFHHKTARVLVRKYDRIAVEDLNVRGLARGMLAKSVADVGWGTFLSILSSKAEGAGAHVVKVDPRGTSQECAACGAIAQKGLSEREHRCDCGFRAHRDHNAALVIRSRAFNGPGSGPRGDTSSEATARAVIATCR